MAELRRAQALSLVETPAEEDRPADAVAQGEIDDVLRARAIPELGAARGARVVAEKGAARHRAEEGRAVALSEAQNVRAADPAARREDAGKRNARPEQPLRLRFAGRLARNRAERLIVGGAVLVRQGAAQAAHNPASEIDEHGADVAARDVNAEREPRVENAGDALRGAAPRRGE